MRPAQQILLPLKRQCAARCAYPATGALAVMAIRRYQLTHNELPDSLQTAVKDAGMQVVPLDPYSGKQLKYAVINGAPAVYSIGSDLKDDNGIVDATFSGPFEPGDYIFRMPQ